MAESALTAPGRWLAIVPLLCVVLAAIYGLGAAFHPGMMPGRGAVGLLLVGCILALALPARQVWSWRSPQPWLLAALLWQGVALMGWTSAREPGLLWWGERSAALLTALGVAAWCQDYLARPRRSLEPLLRGLAGAGAGCLIITAITPPSIASMWVTGIDLPFGNPNFAVGGALPLLGLCLPFMADAKWRVIAGGGLAAAVVLGTGWVSGDACRAVWPGLAAMIGLAAILRLPARSQGWLIGGGEVLVIGGFVLLLLGVMQIPDSTPSTGYRVELWRSAVEAAWQAPWFGTGPASSVIVLQEQWSSPLTWLFVPSYAEHAHNEFLQAVLDGGLINAALLLMAVLCLLAPLWRRRFEPFAAALLLAWAGVLTQALIESHLSQPGPLLLLALLAGVTWSFTGAAAPVVPIATADARMPWRSLLAIPVAALMFAQISREFYDGGSPTMIEFRARQRIAMAPTDHLQAAAEAEAVRARLGDLDVWLTREAINCAKAKDFNKAEILVRMQLQRLPVDPEALRLGLFLRDRHVQLNEASAVYELQDELQRAEARIEHALKVVPANARTLKIRSLLAELVAKIPLSAVDGAETGR